MFLTFLIPFHSLRIDNLLQTIRFLERNESELVKACELILLCQDQCGSVSSKFASTKTVSFKLESMQKCKMVNHGARMAVSDKIIMLDSDRVLPVGYFKSILITLTPKTVVSPRQTHRLTRMVADQSIIDNCFEYKIENRKPANIFSGNAALFKEDYWAAGGMNENYVGYGWEDDDMSQHLLKAKMTFTWRPEIELHLYHPRHSYGAGDLKGLYLDNGMRFHKEWNLPMPQDFQDELYKYSANLL